MVTGAGHTGFVVTDLDKAVRFYEDGLGLAVTSRFESSGARSSQLLGYQDVRLKGAMLDIGGGHVLELLQYINPPPAERPSEERSIIGAAHLALYVDNVDEMFERLISHGGKKLNAPVGTPPDTRATYAQDPDGNWLELVEAAERPT